MLLSPASKAAENESGHDVIAGYKLAHSIKLGQRIFHSECRTCHGPEGGGTTLAPNLVLGAAKLTFQQFATRVLKGHINILGYSDSAGDDRAAVRQAFMDLLGQTESSGVIMPAWEEDPVVRIHVTNLYQYLRALGDGTLEPGSRIQNAN